jgi:probable H4MPT-linked C1 transfer pathway protein
MAFSGMTAVFQRRLIAVNVLAWDIGGANLKASDGEELSCETAFPLWKHPEDLAQAMATIASRFPPADCWAVTMTGELADCFATKAEGVRRILEAAAQAAKSVPLSVWTTVGEFVSPEDAKDVPILAAASNWLALATWVGRMAPEGPAMLIDIGSTTTDIIPLRNGFPDPQGRTDVERLLSGELVYSGARRTPVNTLTNRVTFRRRKCPLASETFASMLDVYLLLGLIKEETDNRETANGRPATRSEAFDRLARMLCADRDECSEEEIQVIANELALSQRLQMSAAFARVSRRFEIPPAVVILSGSGEFLAQSALDNAGKALEAAPRISLTSILGPTHATAACAYALARLARERLAGEHVVGNAPTENSSSPTVMSQP